tara:strand:+ start:122 stop:370 length:249 start_codon:yes stop_codon:yes gene_type:complete
MSNNKSNRGRPKGATSFVRVSLKDLMQQIGENASVVVSKKWLEGITGGVDELPPANTEASQIKEVEEPTPETERIQFTVHND